MNQEPNQSAGLTMSHPECVRSCAHDEGWTTSRIDGHQPIRVVGCGRWSMGDDRAGLVAALALRERWADESSVEILATELVAEALTETPLDCRLLIVVDAGAPIPGNHHPGSWKRIEYRVQGRTQVALDAAVGNSHLMGAAGALALADALNRLPPDVWLYVLEGASFEPGFTLSRTVADALSDAVGAISLDIESWRQSHPLDSPPGPVLE